MQRLEVSCAVRPIWVARRQRVKIGHYGLYRIPCHFMIDRCSKMLFFIACINFATSHLIQ
jgi:hypothetical protein